MDNEQAPTEEELRAALERLPVHVQQLVGADILSGRRRVVNDPTYLGEIPAHVRSDNTAKGRKFSHEDRESMKYEAAMLDRMGYSQYQVARKLGVCQATVSGFLKEMRADYLARIMGVRSEMAAKELAVLLDVRREAWEGLERAKKGLTTTEDHVGGKMGNEFVTTHAEVLPPTEYLNVILKTNARICQMFDLDEAVQTVINVNTTNNTLVTGAALMEAILGHAIGDKRLAELEAGERDHAAALVELPVA